MIEGDLGQNPAFTLSDDVLQTIHIIIHCAATVRFNEPIKKATFINVRGTKQILDYARKMENLQSFVYVSTAFSFSPNPVIEEKVYEVPMDPKSLIAKMEEVTDEEWLKDFEKRSVFQSFASHVRLKIFFWFPELFQIGQILIPLQKPLLRRF